MAAMFGDQPVVESLVKQSLMVSLAVMGAAPNSVSIAGLSTAHDSLKIGEGMLSRRRRSGVEARAMRQLTAPQLVQLRTRSFDPDQSLPSSFV
jgi:hypothetical protein